MTRSALKLFQLILNHLSPILKLLFVTLCTRYILVRTLQDKSCGIVIKIAWFPRFKLMTSSAIRYPFRFKLGVVDIFMTGYTLRF
jgi:hypothetical protein